MKPSKIRFFKIILQLFNIIWRFDHIGTFLKDSIKINEKSLFLINYYETVRWKSFDI